MLKKIVIPLIIIVIVITTIITAIIFSINNYKSNLKEIQQLNSDYESYYNTELLGTTVISIINKTISLNEKNGIEKNNKGEYLENDTNSIIITVQFKGNEDKIFTYRMEAIGKQGSEAFVKNFGGFTFKCTKIEYHEKTKMVKSLFIEQI